MTAKHEAERTKKKTGDTTEEQAEATDCLHHSILSYFSPAYKQLSSLPFL